MRWILWTVAIALAFAATSAQARSSRRTRPRSPSIPPKDAPAAERWVPEMAPIEIKVQAKREPLPELTPAEIEREHARSLRDRRLFRGGVGAVLVVGLVLNFALGRRTRRRALSRLAQAKAEGLDLPASLHPRIDANRCIGCGTCVKGCHEQVLGLLDGRSQLVLGANCVGCGACREGCPVAAIQLVFGTAERGVELPELKPTGETTVKGLYIAGELGGMGLISNAFEQAIRAVDSIQESLESEGPVEAPEDAVALIVVGAGPAGLGAALRAQELGLSYLCLERETWGGAIRNYPRGKIVMTRPIRVPLYGPVKLRETTKEALLALWQRILEATRVKISHETRVDDVKREGPLFRVETSRGPLRCRRVLLATGVAGTPRTLGVPGESECNVAYRMLEPEKWSGRQLAVVGGGDVACEIALALAEQPGTQVTLIYHGKKLTRPKPRNRARVEEAAAARALTLALGAKVEELRPDRVVVSVGADRMAVAAEQVFVCAGGVPPGAFLRQLGVEMVMKHGEA